MLGYNWQKQKFHDHKKLYYATTYKKNQLKLDSPTHNKIIFPRLLFNCAGYFLLYYQVINCLDTLPDPEFRIGRFNL